MARKIPIETIKKSVAALKVIYLKTLENVLVEGLSADGSISNYCCSFAFKKIKPAFMYNPLKTGFYIYLIYSAGC
jgi:hypothetical protein